MAIAESFCTPYLSKDYIFQFQLSFLALSYWLAVRLYLYVDGDTRQEVTGDHYIKVVGLHSGQQPDDEGDDQQSDSHAQNM